MGNKNSDQGDVYQYDDVSERFRWQFYYLMQNVLGKAKPGYWGPDTLSYPAVNARWDAIERLLLESHGIPQLSDKPSFSAMDRVNHFLLGCSANEFLTAVSAFLLLVRQITPDRGRKFGVAYLNVSFDLVNEQVHTLFNLYKFGYEIVETPEGSFRADRVDSKYLHQEIIAESISLLNRVGFKGPQNEFTKAVGYYSQNDFENAISFANRAFESIMKSVFDKLGYDYDKNDTAKQLIHGYLSTNSFFRVWKTCIIISERCLAAFQQLETRWEHMVLGLCLLKSNKVTLSLHCILAAPSLFFW
jgi:hypothetical protein